MNTTTVQSFLRFCKENVSEDSTTDELWELGAYRTNGIVLAVFQTIFLLVGLPWNLIVIVTIVKEKLYKQPTIVLLLNLVIIDLLMLLVVTPLNIVIGAAGEYILGDNDAARCGTCYYGILNTFFPIMSIFTVSILSFDRLLYFDKPLRYNTIVTVPRILMALLVLWVIDILIASLPTIGFGHIIFVSSVASCFLHFGGTDKSYSILVIVIVGVPLIILIVCNAFVVYIVQKTIRAVYAVNKNSTGDNSDKKKRKEKQFHLIRVFGSLVCFNIVSWLPTIVITLRSFFTGLNSTTAAVLVPNFLLFHSQITIHPILESLFISDIRKPLKNMFCCSNRRGSSSNSFSSAT